MALMSEISHRLHVGLSDGLSDDNNKSRGHTYSNTSNMFFSIGSVDFIMFIKNQRACTHFVVEEGVGIQS
jgi:hypothetical protein